VEDLLGDAEKFTANICYHIAPGRIMMGEMTRLNSLRTMSKDDLLIDASRGLQINRARVIEPNIECRNGVIHVIDSVLTLKQRSKVKAGRFAVKQ